MDKKIKTIFITGATGYLGNILLKRLSKKYVIFALYRDEAKIYKINNVVWVKGEIGSLDKNVINYINKSDEIIYLAGVQGMFNNSCLHENVNGIKNFLNIINQNNHIRMIYFSSIEAFGTTTSIDVEIGEKEKPVSEYGLSKLRSEKIIEKYSKKNNNFKYVILRLGNVNMEEFMNKYKNINWIKGVFGDYELNTISELKVTSSLIKILENKNLKNIKRYLVDKNLSLNNLSNHNKTLPIGWWTSDILVSLMRLFKKGGIWYYLAAGGSNKPYRRFSKILDLELKK